MWVPVLFWWESDNLHYSEKCAIRHLENAVHMYQQVTKQMIENSLLNKFKLENECLQDTSKARNLELYSDTYSLFFKFTRNHRNPKPQTFRCMICLVNLVIWAWIDLLKLFKVFVGISALPETHICLIPISCHAMIYRVMCFKCRGSWGCPEDYYSNVIIQGALRITVDSLVYPVLWISALTENTGIEWDKILHKQSKTFHNGLIRIHHDLRPSCCLTQARFLTHLQSTPQSCWLCSHTLVSFTIIKATYRVTRMLNQCKQISLWTDLFLFCCHRYPRNRSFWGLQIGCMRMTLRLPARCESMDALLTSHIYSIIYWADGLKDRVLTLIRNTHTVICLESHHFLWNALSQNMTMSFTVKDN